MAVRPHYPRAILFFLSGVLILAACSSKDATESGPCAGPSLPVQELLTLKQGSFNTGPLAGLVVPNPFDATGDPSATLTSQDVLSAMKGFSLPNLLTPTRLESDLIKIRLHSADETNTSLWASPNSNGQFTFAPSDPRYDQAMAYHSASVTKAYLEALGFTLLHDTPLYIIVQGTDGGSTAQDVNAFYSHGYFGGSRQIEMIGTNVPAPPGVDQDVYFHEFGHFVNESVSHQVGIDYAGNAGASFTEAAALHECLADYLEETVANKPYIGRWVNKNFTSGGSAPLRSATDPSGQTLSFTQVANQDGTGNVPERYGMGEWCERVLWQIRGLFANGHETTGPVFADLLVYSAVSMLQRDTSMSAFYSALESADAKLYCGKHTSSIAGIFNNRGFNPSPAQLSGPLTLSAYPIGFVFDSSGSANPANIGPGVYVIFALQVSNPNSQVARNVRIYLESGDGRFIPQIYMQGLGDLPPGYKLQIPTNNGIGLDHSVIGYIDTSAGHGITIPYNLRIKVENGPDTVGTLGLQL